VDTNVERLQGQVTEKENQKERKKEKEKAIYNLFRLTL
jgi:hypothetical protein